MARLQLFQSAGVEEQWQGVVLPWLRAQSDLAWRESRPTVILTPSRAESFYLRGRLVAEGISFFGLRFWTPSDTRNFLLQKSDVGIEIAGEAELRLMARVCAQQLAANSEEPSLASVERDPRLFLRAYDLLLGAGWSPAREGAPYSRQLAREMEKFLEERGATTQAGVHRLLAKQKISEAHLQNLLVCGFDATHWPLWDLLKAAVKSAQAATVGLLAPRGFGNDIDQLWIGSWEEFTGESTAIPDVEGSSPRAEQFASWVASYEKGETQSATTGDFHFLATADLRTQVQAIVLQALAYLASDSCERLGIIFPEPNALSLAVGEELRRLEVPLDDGTGYLQPGPFERETWTAWIDLQEEPSVGRLIAWVRAAEAGGLGSGTLISSRSIAEVVDNALGEMLIDDLDFLALHLGQASRRDLEREVASFLQSRAQLPETGRFAEFLEITRRALAGLEWNAAFDLENAVAPAWLQTAEWPLSRRIFLAWLRDATDSQERSRGAESNHFYGKVHLLVYAQMPGQTWTHLILTGLNEGSWPRMSESGAFGSRHELAELNREARALNRRSAGQGSQGEGHSSVRPDHGYCLLPQERQELALRDLCAAVEATSESVCLTAMTANGGRTLLPAAFFAAAYQAKRARDLVEESFAALAGQTATWCGAHERLLAKAEPSTAETELIGTTRLAYAARRDREKSFGRFEFAYAEPPDKPIQLPCKVWETAWNHPASVWLDRIVGLKAWPEGELAWPRAVGTWVHRWLTTTLGALRERDDVATFMPDLRATIDREPMILHTKMKQLQIELYPWWHHVWGQARAIALSLGESLVPHLAEHFILTEYPLPKPGLVALPGAHESDFELRGKIDLLLVAPGAMPIKPASGDFADATCWVIDFKTGAAKNLTPSRMEKGQGLQTMLYALAVRARGAQSIGVSLQTAEAALKPQAQIEQIERCYLLFRSLDQMHRSGVFGMRPAPENDYGFAPAYPLAHRPIASEILTAKWALAHGAGDLWEEA